MPKRRKSSGFGRKIKPKEGEDRRHTGSLPGRPRNMTETTETLPERDERKLLPMLLWGDAQGFEAELTREKLRYEESGLLAHAQAFLGSAPQSTYRQRGLGADFQAGRDFRLALEHCSTAEHAANQRSLPFSMAARSISQLSRKAQSHRSWQENNSITSHATAYKVINEMMLVRPEHNFAGRKDLLNAVMIYDQVFRSDGCNTKTGESRGRQRLNAEGNVVNAG